MGKKYADTPLMVITVTSSDLPASDRIALYEFAVILGDCVLPGHILGQYMTQEEANDACIRFADHYRLRRYPYQEQNEPFPMLRLIIGGESEEN